MILDFILLNNQINTDKMYQNHQNKVDFVFTIDCYPRLMRLKLFLSVEIEVGDWLTVLIVTFKCPPWIIAPLNRRVAGTTGLFINFSSALLSLSVITDVRGAFAAASAAVEVECNISDIFFLLLLRSLAVIIYALNVSSTNKILIFVVQ